MVTPDTNPLLPSAETTRSLAERVFSKYPHTTESLQWLHEHMPEFAARINDFEVVVNRLNQLMITPEAVRAEYRTEIGHLSRLIDGSNIPTLTEAEAEDEKARSAHASPVIQTFIQARKEFGWADEEFDPKRPSKSAIGILLEGYGRYVGLRLSKDKTQAEKIQKAFIYAFEAVLLVELPKSELLKDIKEWMQADAEVFSTPIKELLV